MLGDILQMQRVYLTPSTYLTYITYLLDPPHPSWEL